jgi:hypothetical protein
MRTIAFIVMMLMWGSALPATVYKWVDENGVTHYSDQPHPGAQKMEVDAVQTYSAPPPPAGAAAAKGKSKSSAGPVYKSCELYRPTNDEVFFSVSSVTAKLRLDPEFRVGDKATIALDGKRLSDVPFASGEFNVTPVYRGTHTLLAVVEDLAGNVVCQTPSVTFHIRQPSTLAPQAPTRAKPPPRP